MSESSKPQVVTCEMVRYFPDMYPEFAPEEVRDVCTQPAVALLTWTEPDQFGPDTRTHVLCGRHLIETIESCLEAGWPFGASDLNEQFLDDYVTGMAWGMTQFVSERQFEIAMHEDWLAAEVACPEGQRKPFELGWDRALNQRLEKWAEIAYER